jgi:hypothetical protein
MREYAATIRDDGEIISQDLESQRLLLNRLNLLVRLGKEHNGQRLAKIKFNFVVDEESVVIDARTTRS